VKCLHARPPGNLSECMSFTFRFSLTFPGDKFASMTFKRIAMLPISPAHSNTIISRLAYVACGSTKQQKIVRTLKIHRVIEAIIRRSKQFANH
jgi:hypothetical protein